MEENQIQSPRSISQGVIWQNEDFPLPPALEHHCPLFWELEISHSEYLQIEISYH